MLDAPQLASVRKGQSASSGRPDDEQRVPGHASEILVAVARLGRVAVTVPPDFPQALSGFQIETVQMKGLPREQKDAIS
ncbi:MAG TPA: hypothetical protein VLA12_19000, partial [Planctomycetaceae bacterium]|nr:hypothetical protein [Planctomycetaceae bacterium]